MRNTAFKYGSLFIGLIAAAIIILSQSFAFENTTNNHKHGVEQSPAQDDGRSTADIADLTISATSFPAPAQINFFQDAFCLFEVLFSSEDAASEAEPVVIPLSKFFNTILEVIISPNAP